MEVMPREAREGRPGPGITWTAFEPVGAAVMGLRKRVKEKRVEGENLMVVM